MKILNYEFGAEAAPTSPAAPWHQGLGREIVRGLIVSLITAAVVAIVIKRQGRRARR